MRPSMDDTLVKMASVMALRSTCSRKQVGAILAREGRIIATGFNGAPAGMPHCDHDTPSPDQRTSCDVLDPGCQIAVHAEANAIAFAAKYGVPTQDATLYTTMTPCLKCAQLIINAGITRVVARDDYRDLSGWQLLDDAGVQLTSYGEVSTP